MGFIVAALFLLHGSQRVSRLCFLWTGKNRENMFLRPKKNQETPKN
jgi:hypothetical protein